jgi:hypothetical protein
MNKEEILKRLGKLNYDKKEYIVISGASMVVQGVKKDTNDIDISVSDQLNSTLELSDCKFHLTPSGKVYEMDYIELFRAFYEDTKYKVIESYRFATLESILDLKMRLNREKDKKDIMILRKLLDKGFN